MNKRNFNLILIIILLLVNSSFARSICGVKVFVKKISIEYTREEKTITLPIPNGNKVKVDIENYYYENKNLVVSGKINGNSQSEFVLKAIGNNVYGWIHIFAENFEDGEVYTYSTEAGNVVSVKCAKVSDVIKIDDTKIEKKDIHFKTWKQKREALPDIVYLKPMPANVDLNELQSKPGSEKIIWMDIRDLMDGNEPIPYTRDDIWQMWQVVSSGLSTYDVNVTTSKSVYDATPVLNRGIGLFHNADGRSHCAYDMFGTWHDCEIYLKANGFHAGRTALHEYGHLLGLRDQGTGLNGVQWATYFSGYDDLKWVPIMGNFLYSDDWGEETLYQWSDGEYQAGSAFGMPQEDVLSLMNEYLDFEEDDIPDAKPLVINDGAVTAPNNYGMINIVTGSYDEDDFTFKIVDEPSEVDLTIDRIGHIGGAMLDVHASIYDENGTLIIEDNKPAARYARIITTLQPGEYKLRISGGEEGIEGEKFPTYGSIGYYGISGTITNSSVIVLNNKNVNSVKSINRKNGILKFEGIEKQDRMSISIFNMSGRRVFKRQIEGSGTINLKQEIGQGCYLMQLNNVSDLYREKFTILN